jgi:hypothetical protein
VEDAGEKLSELEKGREREGREGERGEKDKEEMIRREGCRKSGAKVVINNPRRRYDPTLSLCPVLPGKPESRTE